MSAFSLEESARRAHERLQKERPRRSDQGTTKFAPRVEAELQRLLHTSERPSIAQVAARLRETCQRWGEPMPSRPSIYNAIKRAVPPKYEVAHLPAAVRSTLLNLDNPQIDGAQLVFHAFNYGSTEALCFASGLPWLCLLRASELSGYRPKSYALLRSVLAYREIVGCSR